MNQNQPATLLPLMIRLTAIGYLLFFIPNLLLAATHHMHPCRRSSPGSSTGAEAQMPPL